VVNLDARTVVYPTAAAPSDSLAGFPVRWRAHMEAALRAMRYGPLDSADDAWLEGSEARPSLSARFPHADRPRTARRPGRCAAAARHLHQQRV
jgi:hypothetical protein